MSDVQVKFIKGFEGQYQVTDAGRVISKRSGKDYVLTSSPDNSGHETVCLYKDGKKKRYRVEVLVANAFLCNFFELPVIGHEDNNLMNNKASNLFYGTYEAVHMHKVKMEVDPKTPYLIRCCDTGVRFETVVDCAFHLDATPREVRRALKKQQKLNGYTLEWTGEPEPSFFKRLFGRR